MGVLGLAMLVACGELTGSSEGKPNGLAAGPGADQMLAGGTVSTNSGGGDGGELAGAAGGDLSQRGGEASSSSGGTGAVAGGSGGASSAAGGGAAATEEYCVTFLVLPPMTEQGNDYETQEPEEVEVCAPKLLCPVGERRQVQTDTEKREFTQSCLPCGEGTFNTKEGVDACLPCRVCGTLGVLEECTAVRNTVCEATGLLVQSGTEGWDWVNALDVDDTGHAWIVGSLVAEDGNNAGGFVSHVAPNGSVELLKHPASYPNEHRLQAVAVAKDGTAWVGGFTGDGGYDGVIHRYPAGGGSRETELVSAGESNQVKIWRMVADDLGNVWAAGETNARLADTHLGSYDLFLRKYSAGSASPETAQFGGPGPDYLDGLTADGAGNLWFAWKSRTTHVEDPSGVFESFISYLPAGSPLGSAKPWTLLESDHSVRQMTSDSSGNLVIVGAVDEPAPGAALFVRKYLADGSEGFTDYFGTEGSEGIGGVVVDEEGRIWVTGGTSCNLTDEALETTSRSQECSPRQPSIGSSDVFVRIYASDGSSVQTEQFGTTGSDAGVDLALSQQKVWLAGSTDGRLGDSAFGGIDGFLWQALF